MLAILLCGIGALAGTDTRSPSFADEIPASATKVNFDFARSCRVEGHEFILEKTTLAQFIAALGRGKMYGNHQDAAGCEIYVDFADGPNLVRFSSNCEMGGDDRELDGVEVRSATATELKALPRLHSHVAFLFGRQGMSFAQLRGRLGSAHFTSDRAYYVHDEKTPVSAGQPADFRAYDSLIATIQHGIFSEIYLARSTTD